MFSPMYQSTKPSLSFKANPNSRVVTVVDEATGVEKQRYVNKDRWKGYGPVTAMYSDSGVGLIFD
jgi:general transcription factor 3C polypeptide 5 (transcription factor C subunit 1)